MEHEKNIPQFQRRLKTAPKGQLRIAVKHNSVEYYYKDAEISNKNGRYMKKNEMNMIKKLDGLLKAYFT